VRAFSSADATLAVERLYRGVLGRPADPGGLAGYAALVQAGRLPVVVSALVTSPEFDGRRPTLTSGTWADALYLELLGRPSDPGGHDVTAGAIVAGNGGQRIVDIVLSPEYDARE